MNRLLIIVALSLLGLGGSSAVAGSIDSEQLRAVVETAALRNLPDTVVAVEVQRITLQGAVSIPGGVEPSIRVLAAGDDDWVGTTSLDLEINVPDQPTIHARVIADLVVFIEVPVLRHPVGRSQEVTINDLALVQRDADRLPSGVLRDPRALIGRVAKRDLGLNQVIRESDLMERVDAARRRIVTLMLKRGNLTITAPGVLKTNARIGDLVEVFSTTTRKGVFGVLVTPDLVEVISPRAAARNSTAAQSIGSTSPALASRLESK